ncbi:Beta-glucosidase cel3A [Leucoagaricus gongylophorus]
MFKLTSFLAFASLVPAFVKAQQPAWAQCGGIGWTGGTTCVSGSVCTEINEFYFQCIPGSSTPPSSTNTLPVSTTTSGSGGPTSNPVPDAGNPYTGYSVWLTPYYADEVNAAASNITDATVKAKALKVAQIPTFTWFDAVAKVPTLGDYLADAEAKQKSTGQKQLVQIVVYDLPDRDCAALASNGEFSIADDGVNKYKDYIDQLAAQIQKFPDIRIVAVIEPDSLANLVTNLSVQKCANAQSAYKESVIYAVQKLNALGVYMYLDAGHAGWLGWPANLTPAAQLFSQLYTSADRPEFLRGLATNVANYNAINAVSPDPITQGNSNYDEMHYINALAPALSSSGFPAHFIIDQGRSGVQNIRQQWGDWCNVKGAGFGIHPTTSTGSSLIDSIVWVKPGGECDGTSNSSSPRFDSHCALSDAAQPAPEAGTWFQDYFVTLVENANPAL